MKDHHAAGAKEAKALKVELLEKRTGEVGNFIAGSIMRTGAAMLKKGANK